MSAIKDLREQKAKIVFLYASPQSGHKSCADAVRRALELNPSSLQTVGVDVVTMLSPILGTIISRTYHELLKYTPQIWDFLYDNPEIEEISRELRQLFNFFNASKLNFLLKAYRPSAFVCTHALPCGVIAEQKKRGNCNLPLVAIVTDYAVHSYWTYPEVDLYIVANKESQKTLTDRGIRKERIKILGIPVDPIFNKKVQSQIARKKLELDPSKSTILIMGGSYGLGPIQEIVEELVSPRFAAQILVVTGINKGLYKQLSAYQTYKHVKIYGYTHLIPLLMDAADLLVTKPGGITASEALVKELPMILINPIPGQEERNARYLLKNRVAIQVRKIKDLRAIVTHLLIHPAKLSLLSEKAGKISTPFATKRSVEEIARLLNHSDYQNQFRTGGSHLQEERNTLNKNSPMPIFSS